MNAKRTARRWVLLATAIALGLDLGLGGAPEAWAQGGQGPRHPLTHGGAPGVATGLEAPGLAIAANLAEPNLAQGKPVRASSWRPANPPERAVDGDPGTFWASNASLPGPYAQPAGPGGPEGPASAWPEPPAAPPPPDEAAAGSSPGLETAPRSHNHQWIMVDLGGTFGVQRIHMAWGADFARGYTVYAHLPGTCGGWCALGATASGDGDDTLTLGRPIAVRFLLLMLIYPASPGGSYALREWEVFGAAAGGTPAPPREVAAGKPAYASSQLPGYEAPRATDRQPATEWRPARPLAWLYVDLGAPYTVDRAVLRWAGGMHASRFVLFAWTGYSWQAVGGVSGGDGGEDVVAIGPVRSRYLLVYTMQGGPAIALSELEVWTSVGAGPYAAPGGPFAPLPEWRPGERAPEGAPPADLPQPGGPGSH